jgi:hypothetical protein
MLLPGEDAARPSKRRKRISFWLCLILTLVVVNTSAHIEYWNAKAGGFLPYEGPYKWRWRWSAREGIERRIRRRRTYELSPAEWEDESALRAAYDRPLTREEEDEMYELIQEAIVNNELRGWVAAGCWQYLLAPVALIWSIRLSLRLRRGYRIASVLMGALVASCIFLMLYRGYLSSHTAGW